MYQKCPICNGSGNTYSNYSLNTSTSCKTCNGKGIISQLTGLPPIDTYKVVNVISTDFRDNCEQQWDK